MNTIITIPTQLREQVKASQAFQKLSKLQQKVHFTGQNVRGINNGLTIAKTVGISRWREISGNNYISSQIIEELHLNQLEVELSILK